MMGASTNSKPKSFPFQIGDYCYESIRKAADGAYALYCSEQAAEHHDSRTYLITDRTDGNRPFGLVHIMSGRDWNQSDTVTITYRTGNGNQYTTDLFGIIWDAPRPIGPLNI